MNEESEKSPGELRHEIEETRENLGDTVDALSAKADVKSRAKGAVNEQVDELAARTRQQPLMYLGVAAAAGLVLGFMLRRR